MAETRKRKSPSSAKKMDCFLLKESKLLDWLNNSQQLIPKKWKDFLDFIYKNHDSNYFPEETVKSVWMKLKEFEKKIKQCPTIVLSSDEDDPILVTEILDFDEMNSENEPNITYVQIPTSLPKTPEKKKRECHRSPNMKVKESSNTSQDQALLKKFKQQIILEELLKRDKEMMLIQQKKDKLQSAIQIELGYSKRIQKERVEALAQDMLRLHKAGFQDSLSPNSFVQSVCLVDQPPIIPSEGVIAERLPTPDPFSGVLSQEMPSDQINYDMVYPLGEGIISDQSSTRRKRSCKKSDPNNSKRVKKKKRSSIEKSREAEELRHQIYIDTIIEMTMPDVIEEMNGLGFRLRSAGPAPC